MFDTAIPTLETSLKAPNELSDQITTPTQLAQENPNLFTQTQINWLLKTRHKNGLTESGAVLKISRKLYINRSLFMDWFLSQKAA